MSQLAANTGAGGSQGSPSGALEHLGCYRSRGNPTLLAADSSGLVRVFDLRAGGVVGSTQHLKSRLAGGERCAGQGWAAGQGCARRGGAAVRGRVDHQLCACPLVVPEPPASSLHVQPAFLSPRSPYTSSAYIPPLCVSAPSLLTPRVPHPNPIPAGLVVEPGGLEHQVVLGYPNGQLAFLDCRVLSGGAGEGGAGGPRVECGVWKSLEAHSRGPMTTLVGHKHAPLLATSTAQQVGRRGEA